MKEKMFLGKVKNSEDRDCVKYIEFNGFECGHYFGGFYICGACFCGFDEDVFNNIDNLETILSRDELVRLEQYKNAINELGYGIEKGDERYNQGVALQDGITDIIEHLKSNENKELFEKVIEEEKEYCINEYGLSKEDVDYIFQEYNEYYQDRSIISCVFADFDEMVEEEKFSFGYDKQPYFDDESFGRDLLESDDYLELDNGKIVMFSY